MLFIYSLLFILVATGVGLLFLFLNCRKNRSLEYEKLQNTIALLKMQNIRNRMSSHFFFNTLGGISTESDQPELVKKDLNTLSMLLRRSVENIENIGISLEEELEVVRGYIGLHKWRIPMPFNVEFDIPDVIDTKYRIPAMCIQIPVENAIKHGLLPVEGDKQLLIKIRNEINGIEITIQDNGIGIGASPNRSCGTGTGLKVLIQTIYFLNKKNTSKIDLSISEQKFNQETANGTVVRIKVPVNYSFEI